MRLIRRPSPLLALAVVVLLVAALGAVLSDGTAPRDDQGTASAWVSSPADPARRLLRVDPQPGATADAEVRVEPADRRQVWRGTGAAMTDASVELLTRQPDGLGRLFGTATAAGAQLSWVRLPLSATDMSPRPWTWGWDGTTASPSPQAREAAAIVARLSESDPGLRVVAAAWTAPVWMKEPAGLRGGALRDDQVEQYAALLLAQVDALRSLGVPVAALSLGNEPGHTADYPSMTMSTAQQAALARIVAPRLRDRRVELWAVDHNWADRPRYDEVLAQAPDAFDAAAFHCYAGRPGQMSGVGVPPIITECTGTTSSWSEAFAWDARHLVADSVAAGSTGLMTWNLAVDRQGGPRDQASISGCATCRGLLTVDGADVEAGPEFYVLAHVARAASPGARVVGSRSSAGIVATAFVNQDGSVGVFALNDSGADRVVAVRVPGRAGLYLSVREGELLSLRIGQ